MIKSFNKFDCFTGFVFDSLSVASSVGIHGDLNRTVKPVCERPLHNLNTVEVSIAIDGKCTYYHVSSHTCS